MKKPCRSACKPLKIKSKNHMKRILLPALCIALLTAACARINPQGPAPESLQALLEQMEPDTRSNVSDEGHFVWNTWDQVSVLTSAGSFVPFSITSGAGTNKASFVGNLEEGVELGAVAVYPAGSHSIQGNTLSVNYPSSYTYPADTTDSYPVMIARLGGGSPVSFIHVGGLMRIRYKNVPVKATHMVITFHKQVVTGDFSLNLAEDEPTATMYDGSSQVVINFTSPTEPANTRHFYLPLPCGDLTDMTLEFRDASDALIPGTQYESHSVKTVTRKRLLKMPGLVLTVINAGIDNE